MVVKKRGLLFVISQDRNVQRIHVETDKTFRSGGEKDPAFFCILHFVEERTVSILFGEEYSEMPRAVQL